MSGYVQETLDLIKEIEKGKKPIDFIKFKDKFFFIEIKIKKIENFERHFSNLIQEKMDNVKKADQDNKTRVLIAYLNMVDALGKSKDAVNSTGIIVLMIPVICELIRECL